MKNKIETWEDLENYIISLENENEYLKQQLHKVLECMAMLEDDEVINNVRVMGEKTTSRK